jgi:enamine deaminase RidA (YjgF/YER057c/UK114 family)
MSIGRTYIKAARPRGPLNNLHRKPLNVQITAHARIVRTLLVTAALSADKQGFHLHEEGENAIGYSQAMRAGNTLYISGTVGAGEMKNAIKEAYDKLRRTLAAYGIGFGDVVKETTRLLRTKKFARSTTAQIVPRPLGYKWSGSTCLSLSSTRWS